MVKSLFTLSSCANVLGGAVLVALWGMSAISGSRPQLPFVVLAIGGAMLIQGLYSAGYSLGWWSAWGDLASGALLAGQLISGCVGFGLLMLAIFHFPRASNGGVEPGPVLAALLIGANALVCLILLVAAGALKPKPPARAGP